MIYLKSKINIPIFICNIGNIDDFSEVNCITNQIVKDEIYTTDSIDFNWSRLILYKDEKQYDLPYSCIEYFKDITRELKLERILKSDDN